MKSRTRIWLIVATIVWVIASPATATAQPRWKSPWKFAPKANLFTLTNEGYNTVDVIMYTVPQPIGTRPNVNIIREIVYLRKGRSLFRCWSQVYQGVEDSETHICFRLVAPPRHDLKKE